MHLTANLSVGTCAYKLISTTAAGDYVEPVVETPTLPTSTRKSLSVGLTFADMDIADADTEFLDSLCSVTTKVVARGIALQGFTESDISCAASARAGSVLTTIVTTLPENVSADAAQASVSSNLLAEVAADTTLSTKGGAVSALTVATMEDVEDLTTLFAPVPRIGSMQNWFSAGSAEVVIEQPSLRFDVAFVSVQGSVDVPMIVTGFASEDVTLEFLNLVPGALAPLLSATVVPLITAQANGGADQVLSYSLVVVADERWLSNVGCDHVRLAVSVPAGAAVGSNNLDSKASAAVIVDWYPGARA